MSTWVVFVVVANAEMDLAFEKYIKIIVNECIFIKVRVLPGNF